MLANRFSALDIFWKRKEEREGEYGVDDERQKKVCPGLSPRGMRSALALQHAHIKGLLMWGVSRVSMWLLCCYG